jgi:hypothetical protein
LKFHYSNNKTRTFQRLKWVRSVRVAFELWSSEQFFLRNACFLAQFGWTKHWWVFQRLQLALVLRTRACYFDSHRKTHSCMFYPNCNRNNAIT